MTSFLTPYNPGGTGSGEAAHVTGNGIVVHNNGHMVGRPLIAGGGMEIRNNHGIDGKPAFAAAIQGQLAFVKKVPCHIAGATLLPVNMPGILHYRITHIVFTNATGTPVELRAGLYTDRNKGGVAILPATQAYTGLVDDIYSTLEIPITTPALREKRSAPYLYWVPEIVNTAEMYVDIHVRGEVLEWEI